MVSSSSQEMKRINESKAKQAKYPVSFLTIRDPHPNNTAENEDRNRVITGYTYH
jgi:hypothetical protein